MPGMPGAEAACRLWVIEGRVQGVGFRWFAVKRAEALGVAGWVRNRDDGAVEVAGLAETSVLDQFEAVLRRGPPGSRVTRLTSSDVPHDYVEGKSFIVMH